MARKTTLTAISLYGALAMVSCTGHHDSDGVGSMHRELQEIRAEATRHHAAVTTIDSVADLPEEAERHRRTMSGSMMHMDDAMRGMGGHCKGQGMTQLRAHMQDMGAALEEHLDSLESAPDIARAHEACSDHTEAMQARIDRMDEALGRVGCM